MSLKKIKSNSQAKSGFTIVELLIVVVVIAILAAITIVSYNGITARANSSSAAAAAATVQKKAELFAADGTTNKYPSSFADLTGASSDKTYALSGVTLQTANPTSSNGTNTVSYLKCAAATVANQAAITSSNVAGAKITFYDFVAGAANKTISIGDTTSCPTS
jgi:type IV pilus assembly protein PilA